MEFIALLQPQVVDGSFKACGRTNQPQRMMGIATAVELTALILGDAEHTQNAVRLLILETHIGRIQLDTHTNLGGLGEESLHLLRGDHIQHGQIILAGSLVNQRTCKMCQTHFTERKIHVQKAIQTADPQLCAALIGLCILGTDGKAGHMQVGGGNDHKSEIIKAGGGNTQRHILIDITLTAEYIINTLSRRQRQSLCDMRKGLLLIPRRGTRNGIIPIVVGKHDATQLIIFGILQNTLGRLLGITGAAGQLGVNVIIIVKYVSHGKNSFRVNAKIYRYQYSTVSRKIQFNQVKKPIIFHLFSASWRVIMKEKHGQEIPMAEPITSEVQIRHGIPTLSVNGRQADRVAYMTYLTENNRYEDFAQAGYRVYSLPLFFGTNNLNEFSGSRSFTRGIYDTEIPCYTEFDRNIKRILSVCPDAMILPRVNVNLSETWEAAHPEELCDISKNADPSHRRACLASDAWVEEVKQLLSQLVAHIESSPYVNSIIGYQIAGGNTEEWLAYDGNAFLGRRAREKFNTLLHTGEAKNTPTDLYRFLSGTVADRICELAAHLKEITQRRLVIGTFYGYTLEAVSHTVGHTALGKLLRCHDIDFICSPIAYSYNRTPGIDHAYMVPLHSLNLHGKLYFSENDTRTHLSKAFNDHPYYRAPIWFGPEKEQTLSILKMHFARSLINAHASWWFDMWGGWYADIDYMAFMRRAREIMLEAQNEPYETVTEIALFVDEDAYNDPDLPLTARANAKLLRRELGLLGAPCAYYLASDFEAVKDRYRALVLLVPKPTLYSDEIEKYAAKHHLPLLTVTPQTKTITAEILRDFCRHAGISLTTDHPAVVYENTTYLFIHAAEDGMLTLPPPKNGHYLEMFTGKQYGNTLPVKKGESFLLRK